MEQGNRFNTGKLKWSLVPFRALEPMVEVLMFGAKKYSNYELFSIFAIETIINDRLCQKLKIAKNAHKVNVSLQEGCVVDATPKKLAEKLIVVNVENIEKLSQKIFYVNHVTKEKDFLKNQKRVKRKKFIKKNITQNLKTKKKKDFEIEKGDKIQNMSKNNQEMIFLETLLNTGLLNNNTVIYCQEGAESAEVKKDHTLTMTIKLGSSEIYFVVNATKLLDCYKIILKLLEIFLNISININDISTFRSGTNNWKKGLPYTEICESLLRHTHSFLNGQNRDKESKLLEVGHILCNALFLSYMTLFRPDLDDRYTEFGDSVKDEEDEIINNNNNS